jgi:hypothetical protein
MAAARSEGWTALFDAAGTGCQSTVRLLLDFGVDDEIKSK